METHASALQTGRREGLRAASHHLTPTTGLIAAEPAGNPVVTLP